MRLPDPHSSRAVLIGTSSYRSEELPDLPAVANNLRDLVAVLTDPELGGLSGEACAVLADPPDPRAAFRALRRGAAEATDLFLVYAACHGRTGPRNELYLAVADTDPDELPVSALGFDLVRQVLRDSAAANRVVILDCCFSGRAIADMSGDTETVLGQLGVEGSYVLTATPANAVALAPEGARHTAFTGELLDLIRTGIPAGPELLTFAVLYRQLAYRTRSRGLPTPCQRGTGTVDHLALTRNPAFPPTPPPEGPSPPHDGASPAPEDPSRPPVGRSLLTRRAAVGAVGAVALAAVGAGWYRLRAGSAPAMVSRPGRILRGHVGAVAAVAFGPDGALLGTAGFDGTARLWNLAAGACVLTVTDPTGPIHDIAFSPDGARFVTPGHQWMTQGGQQPTLIHPASASTAYSVAFSPDGKTLAIGYADSTVAMSSTADGRTIRTIAKAHPSGVTSLAFSPNGRILATASGGAPVRLWDVATGANIMDLAEGQGPVVYAPGGGTIATQDIEESTIALWDSATGRNTALFTGHNGLIRGLSYHPDGTSLASAGDDYTVRRWQVATGQSTVFGGHTAPVLGVAFHPDGRQLASVGEDATVRIWNVDR